jgi:hypothetical protein
MKGSQLTVVGGVTPRQRSQDGVARPEGQHLRAAHNNPFGAVTAVAMGKRAQKSRPDYKSPLKMNIQGVLLSKKGKSFSTLQILQRIDDYSSPEIKSEFKTETNQRGLLALAYKQNSKHKRRIEKAVSDVRCALKP